MTARCKPIVITLVAVSWFAGSACGPIRLDPRPHVRGTIVAVDGRALGIRHKTGRTHEVTMTSDTRVVNDERPEDLRLCAGQRATVILDERDPSVASQVTVLSGRCQ